MVKKKIKFFIILRIRSISKRNPIPFTSYCNGHILHIFLFICIFEDHFQIHRISRINMFRNFFTACHDHFRFGCRFFFFIFSTGYTTSSPPDPPPTISAAGTILSVSSEIPLDSDGVGSGVAVGVISAFFSSWICIYTVKFCSISCSSN